MISLLKSDSNRAFPACTSEMVSIVASDEFIDANFDLLADNDPLYTAANLQEATGEDVQQVENIVQDAMNIDTPESQLENEVFTGPVLPVCHVTVNEQILDNYASAEHKNSMKHQSKWAVNVFKGISNNFH